jgi:hypothetical protein
VANPAAIVNLGRASLVSSIPATGAQCVLLVWGLERFAAATATLAGATADVVTASRDELRLRRCAASRAHRANLSDAQEHLTRIAPERAELWRRATAHIQRQWEDGHEETCRADDWGAVAHRERNDHVPASWPNWRPRFVHAP